MTYALLIFGLLFIELLVRNLLSGVGVGVADPERQHMVKRVGELTMIIFAEPIAQLSFSNDQCKHIDNAKPVVMALVFLLALLYFGAQPQAHDAHVLTDRSRWKTGCACHVAA